MRILVSSYLDHSLFIISTNLHLNLSFFQIYNSPSYKLVLYVSSSNFWIHIWNISEFKESLLRSALRPRGLILCISKGGTILSLIPESNHEGHNSAGTLLSVKRDYVKFHRILGQSIHGKTMLIFNNVNVFLKISWVPLNFLDFLESPKKKL